MKVLFVPVAMILLLASPAYGQSKEPTMPTPEQMLDGKTPDQVEKEEAADRAYKESLKKIPNAKAPSDPWGSARGAEAAKAPAIKKPPAKRGNSPN